MKGAKPHQPSWLANVQFYNQFQTNKIYNTLNVHIKLNNLYSFYRFLKNKKWSSDGKTFNSFLKNINIKMPAKFNKNDELNRIWINTYLIAVLVLIISKTSVWVDNFEIDWIYRYAWGAIMLSSEDSNWFVWRVHTGVNTFCLKDAGEVVLCQVMKWLLVQQYICRYSNIVCGVQNNIYFFHHCLVVS